MDGMAVHTRTAESTAAGRSDDAVGDTGRQTRTAAHHLAGMVPPHMGTMLELCAGYGGFSLALQDVAQPICYIERDSYAASVLASHIKAGRLHDAPIWDDVDTFDGRPWRGLVDIVAGGIPCQPFSAAGKQLGVDDDRWLWPSIARLLAEVEPRYVFLENVPQLVRHGLPEVLADLARLGFDAEWGLLSAAAVGAPHRRERFWLLGHAENDRLQEGWEQSRVGRRDVDGPSGAPVADTGDFRRDVLGDAREVRGAGGTAQGSTQQRQRGRDEAGHGSADVADTGRAQRQGGGRQPTGPQHARTADPRPTVADAASVGLCSRLASRTPKEQPGAAICGCDVADAASVDEREPHDAARPIARGDTRQDAGWRGFPPPPGDDAGWADWIAQGGPEPGVRRGTDGAPPWLADALHLGGNGLVPQCARAAWELLTERLGKD